MEFLVYYSWEEKPFHPYHLTRVNGQCVCFSKKIQTNMSCLVQTKAVGIESRSSLTRNTCIRDENYYGLRLRMRCMEYQETEECVSAIKCFVLSPLNSRDLKAGKDDGAGNLMRLSENLCCSTGPETTTTALTQATTSPCN